MSGAILQLNSLGHQDKYLTDNPQLSFFKNSYKRHTNFSIETIEDYLSGNTKNALGSELICDIKKNGDLVSKIYLKVNINANVTYNEDNEDKIGQWGWVKNLGHNIIDTIKLEIGGNTIDTHYNDWLSIWYELSKNNNQINIYDEMIGNTKKNYNIEYDNINPDRKNLQLYIPINFYFTKNYNLSLPIISLIYHTVKIKISFKNKDLIYNKTHNINQKKDIIVADYFKVDCSINNPSLLIDYIFLDNNERKFFAQSSHQYLIDAIQLQSKKLSIDSTNKTSLKLNLSHPVKSLFWTINSSYYNNIENKYYYLSNGDLEIATKRFILAFFINGEDSVINYGDIFTHVYYNENDKSKIFTLDMLKDKYKNILNKNNKNIREIINSAYYNNNITINKDNNVCMNTITLNDIVVPELLPIEILSLNNSYFDNISENFIFTDTSNIMRNNNKTATSGTSGDYIHGNIGSKYYDVLLHDYNNYGLYLDGSGHIIDKITLTINNHKRIDNLEAIYFNHLQPYKYFNSSPKNGIYVYSFALKPLDFQPSGSCNFSKIDNTTLSITFNNKIDNDLINYDFINTSTINIYALYYNILKIKGGFGTIGFY